MAGAFPIISSRVSASCCRCCSVYKELYYWLTRNAHNATLNPTLRAHKFGWLSPTMFFVRYCIYGGILSTISWYFAKKSREQDETGDPKITDTLRIVAGPAMILYAFTTNFLAFDVLMSIAPKWYSTIYGVQFWGSGNVGAFAALALIVLWVAAERPASSTR